MRNIKSLLTVALNEIKGRSSLLGASLVIGIFPLLFCFLGKTFGLTSNYDDIGLVTYAIMLCCAIGFSLISGASILGNDLSNRQMSFYFSRPLSSLIVWGGKILATLGVVIAGSTITLLPSLLLFTNNLKQSFTPDLVVNFVALVLFFSGLGLVGGIVFRSKSFFLGLDLALTPIVIGLGGLIFWKVLIYYAGSYYVEEIGFSKNFDIISLAIGFVGLAMIISTGVGIVVGRTDIKQVHRALSSSLWSLLFFVVLSGFAFSQWIVSASPKDITRISESSILEGEKWMIFSGNTWGRGSYMPTFLFNLNTKTYVSLPNESRAYVSNNGNKAIWLEEKGISAKEYQLVKVDLTSNEAKPIYTKFSFPERGTWKLSDDGSLAISVRQSLISIIDLNQDKELATVNIPTNNGWPYKMLFLSPEKIRMYYSNVENASQNISIFDVDVKAQKASLEGKLSTSLQYMFEVSKEGDKLFLYRNRELYDGKTGKFLTNLPTVSSDSAVNVRFMDNNKVAFVEILNNEATLKIFSLDKNAVEQTISLGKAQGAYIVSKASDDELLVNTCPDTNAGYYRWQAVAVNLKNSAVVVKGQNLRPALNSYWEIQVNNHASLDKISSSYYMKEKEIVKLDLTTNELKTVTNANLYR